MQSFCPKKNQENSRRIMNIEIKELTKKYGSAHAVSDVNLSFEPGRIVGLLGPNGSGKTTLIKLMNGIVRPTSGKISFDGHSPGVYSKSKISYLPDKTFLDGNITVNGALDYFADFFKDFNLSKAKELLKRLNLPMDKKFRALSKGTQEKVQLVLVMSREAELYLLDEPIGGVDPIARDYILETIISNYNPNATVLISTHLIHDVENILDDVVMIKDGVIKLCDSVENIRTKHGKSIDEMFKEVMK